MSYLINVRIDVTALKNPVSNLLRLSLTFPKSLAILVLASALLLNVSNPLHAAQDTIRGSTATTKFHPELSPQGIHASGFTLAPSFSYSGSFDDNVFATNNNKESAYVSELIPVIAAHSNWNNHALNFSASSNIINNHDFSSEDVIDWDVNTDGKLDIRHDIKLTAGIGAGRDHIARTAPNDVRGVEPTKFDKTSFFTRYSQKFGRIKGAIKLNVLRKEYRNVDAIRAGISLTLDNSDRDRTEYTVSLRGDYGHVGNERIFIQLRGFKKDYDEVQRFSQLDRSSDGVEATLGAGFDYHGLLLGELSLGYRSQDYKEPFPDINTPIARTNIQWNMTDLTTISFDLDRSIQETVNLFFSGYISTTATLKLDHELQRNLIFDLSLLYDRQKYVGISPANRDDKTYDIITGTTYKVNRNLYLTMQYHYLKRISDQNTTLTNSSRFDFRKNLVFLQLQTQF